MTSCGLITFETLECESVNMYTPDCAFDVFVPSDGGETPDTQTIIPDPKPIPQSSESASHRFPIHDTIRQKLDAFYQSQKIPHIIFHGASGTGKFTIVQEFIHKIYNGDKQRIKTNVMTVNCSHGKGIKFIREELKFFAKTNIQTSSGVLFKTIVLINAHHLTTDAQSALRRCIELFSYNTRFFIVLENKHKLLKPILSRFCEIYVPEYTDSANDIINLHEHTLSHKQTPSVQRQHFQEYIHTQLFGFLQCKAVAEHTEKVFSEHGLSAICEDFYNKGISALDIMEWINQPKNQTLLTPIHLSNCMLCFYRIKPEFRCEKMLMFYMIHFILSSTPKLPLA